MSTPTRAGPHEIGAAQIGFAEVGAAEVGHDEARAGEIRRDEVGDAQIRVLQGSRRKGRAGVAGSARAIGSRHQRPR